MLHPAFLETITHGKPCLSAPNNDHRVMAADLAFSGSVIFLIRIHAFSLATPLPPQLSNTGKAGRADAFAVNSVLCDLASWREIFLSITNNSNHCILGITSGPLLDLGQLSGSAPTAEAELRPDSLRSFG